MFWSCKDMANVNQQWVLRPLVFSCFFVPAKKMPNRGERKGGREKRKITGENGMGRNISICIRRPSDAWNDQKGKKIKSLSSSLLCQCPWPSNRGGGGGGRIKPFSTSNAPRIVFHKNVGLIARGVFSFWDCEGCNWNWHERKEEGGEKGRRYGAPGAKKLALSSFSSLARLRMNTQPTFRNTFWPPFNQKKPFWKIGFSVFRASYEI